MNIKDTSNNNIIGVLLNNDFKLSVKKKLWTKLIKIQTNVYNTTNINYDEKQYFSNNNDKFNHHLNEYINYLKCCIIRHRKFTREKN